MDVNWGASYNLRLSAGVGFHDAELTENYCGEVDANGNPVTDCDVADLQAPDGTRLPVTADYKGNLTARYSFDIADYEAYWQSSVVHEGRRTSDLRILERNILGDLPAYTLVDFAIGVRKNNWSMDFYIKNLFDENAQYSRNVQCPETVCAAQVYSVAGQPRTFGIRFSQEF